MSSIPSNFDTSRNPGDRAPLWKKRRLEAEPRDLTKLAHNTSYARSQGNCEQRPTRFALILQAAEDHTSYGLSSLNTPCFGRLIDYRRSDF